mmetsp:Transcript_8888/g.34880  ORF Transcript_8888/g.34880 Transcript_8888/m.34880 type:complete len:259 (-) Transcript_8888:1323-2099(-)
MRRTSRTRRARSSLKAAAAALCCGRRCTARAAPALCLKSPTRTCPESVAATSLPTGGCSGASTWPAHTRTCAAYHGTTRCWSASRRAAARPAKRTRWRRWHGPQLAPAGAQATASASGSSRASRSGSGRDLHLRASLRAAPARPRLLARGRSWPTRCPWLGRAPPATPLPWRRWRATTAWRQGCVALTGKARPCLRTPRRDCGARRRPAGAISPGSRRGTTRPGCSARAPQGRSRLWQTWPRRAVPPLTRWPTTSRTL